MQFYSEIYIITCAVSGGGDILVIVFKARLQKSRDRYYIYIPKNWVDELREAYERRKKVKVIIET